MTSYLRLTGQSEPIEYADARTQVLEGGTLKVTVADTVTLYSSSAWVSFEEPKKTGSAYSG
jgi:hypothetical protein